ncbi:MAG: SufD family Fe-S cluster assembly protein [Crenarchaeota archaeon]|nr:SufD family Fe-S cluster assembly protein [Thermoproteota archaeon]
MDVKERAKRALSKPAPFGPDIDVLHYIGEEVRQETPSSSVEELASRVGVELRSPKASALYYQRDERIEILKTLTSCVDIKPIESVDKDELEYLWRLVPPDTDKYVASVALYGKGGYFIRVRKGCRVELPIQTCFFMSGGAQLVHNVVVVEDGAEAIIVTGCTIMPESIGFHSSVTEIYLGRGSKLIDVTIHSWNRVTHVRPRTAAVLSEGATYVSYYVNMSRTRTIQTLPRIELRGDGSQCYSASIILGAEDSEYDIGSLARLLGRETRAELVSKVIARDRSRVVSRLKIEASGSRSKGFTECSALILSPSARVETIPELDSASDDSELHHEASIGRIRDEEIEYLMLKGFDYREAVSILIRGFVEVNLDFLPESVRKSMESVLKVLAERSIV